jgi:hypothetical protein
MSQMGEMLPLLFAFLGPPLPNHRGGPIHLTTDKSQWTDAVAGLTTDSSNGSGDP